MKNIDGLKRESGAYAGLGLALVLFALQGCQTPFIDIKVNTCGAGSSEETTKPDGGVVGACNKKPHGNANVTGFWDDATQRWMSQTNKTCKSGTICKSTPGTCTGGMQSCINHYNSSTEGCSCGCPPTL